MQRKEEKKEKYISSMLGAKRKGEKKIDTRE
jgi:hypothetical protein